MNLSSHPLEVDDMEWNRAAYQVTCDPSKLDIKLIGEFLTHSYWAKGIPLHTVEKALENSLCFAVRQEHRQIGFARVITDYATFAYLGDVFILPEYRGLGLGQWLMECVISHPQLQNFRRWILATRDAHGLYRKFGFTSLKKPENFMEKHNPEVYARGA